MNVTIDTTNFDHLKDFYQNLSLSDQRKVFVGAFRRAANPIVSGYKGVVPVYSGRLKKSIGTMDLRGEVAILIGALRQKKGWHGHLIENGTRERFRRTMNNAPTGAVLGTKYFEKIYNANEESVFNEIEKAWLLQIDRMIMKINKKK